MGKTVITLGTMTIAGPEEAAPEPAIRLLPVGTKAKGWGYEPETREAIAWLLEKVRPGMSVCDVGAGTGILALIAAKLGAKVVAYESVDRIREVTAANIALNKADVELRGAYDGAGGFDLVVANLGDKFDYTGVLQAGQEV